MEGKISTSHLMSSSPRSFWGGRGPPKPQDVNQMRAEWPNRPTPSRRPRKQKPRVRMGYGGEYFDQTENGCIKQMVPTTSRPSPNKKGSHCRYFLLSTTDETETLAGFAGNARSGRPPSKPRGGSGVPLPFWSLSGALTERKRLRREGLRKKKARSRKINRGFQKISFQLPPGGF